MDNSKALRGFENLGGLTFNILTAEAEKAERE
jgi:hypothetical protein